MARDPIIEEAARWRVRVEAGTADAGELEAWLAVDRRRRSAFDKVQMAWGAFEDVNEEPAVIGVRRDLRRRIGARSKRAPALAAAACLAAAAVMTAIFMGWPVTRVYEAPGHGRQIVRLADGSTVLLDNGSRLKVRYSGRRRDLLLEKGQARFEVAHDSNRPFVVRAGPRRVIATGTVFDIDLQRQGVAVALLQGKVKIVAARQLGAALPALDLRQGEEYRSDPRGAGVSRFDPDVVTAWETGHLVLNDVPLGDAVRRVNRYADRPIVLASAKVAGLRVSGVFHTGDVRAFAEAVAMLMPLSASCRDDGAIVLSVRSTAGDRPLNPPVLSAGRCA